MKTKTTEEQGALLTAHAAFERLYEKQGGDIRVYDYRGQGGMTDFYVIVTGRSRTHTAALCDDLSMYLSDRGIPPLRTEGLRGGEWILVDCGDVIVHILDRPTRDFYRLDKLYEDARLDTSSWLASVGEKLKSNDKTEKDTER